MQISLIPQLFTGLAVALTAKQRLHAMSNLQQGDTIFTNKWFIVLGLSLVVVLSVILLCVRKLRLERDSEKQEREFKENCHRFNFTTDERRIFEAVVERSGLRNRNSIFTMPDVFDSGAGKLMQEVFSAGLDINQRKRLNVTVNSIKNKLGFKKRTYAFTVRSSKTKGLTSRQIPVGKRLSVARSGSDDNTRCEGVVVSSDEIEMVVKTEQPLLGTAGEKWNVHYKQGASVWEFDVLALHCDGDQLVFNHSDKIRFINRRRFLRVAVDLPAMVTKFESLRSSWEEERKMEMLPEFYRAKVRELSGPGLKLETNMDVKNGERILVIFELDEKRIVQDVGEIRGIRKEGDHRLIGVELVGLTDFAVDELVKATNNAAIGYAMEDDLSVNKNVLEKING